MLIRSENSTDYDQVFKLNSYAFERKDEAILIDKIRQSDSFVPQLSLVAESDNSIVGHILFTKVKINNEELLALAPMAVIPGKQKDGISKLLIENGISIAKDLGFRAVLVLGHPDYYKKFGFTTASDYGIKAPWANIPDDAFMAIELFDGALNNISGVVDYGEIFNDSL